MHLFKDHGLGEIFRYVLPCFLNTFNSKYSFSSDAKSVVLHHPSKPVLYGTCQKNTNMADH